MEVPRPEGISERTMTYYIAAYDTESCGCLAACRKIVEVHRQYEMPATFFITGRTLEANPAEYRTLLDDSLFEVASHTYSHKILRDHPFCGKAVPEEQKRKEIFDGKASIERVFERPCLGLRPACGFDNGLRDAPDVLDLIQKAGFHYVSSLAWGPDYSLPALLTDPFNYAPEGFPELWELPCHGWHDNLLKDNNRWGPRRLTLWPPAIPEAIPRNFISTPEEEFAIYRVFLEKAVSEDQPFVSLIWHPWSLDVFDPAMNMLKFTFTHVRELGLKACTYGDLFWHLSSSSVMKT
jgi:peptidoglycan/xylan/chitin deacetylase (PgdA/CDA1 family)